MAMGQCKECKKEVSTSAKVCPNCGVKNPTTKASDVLGGFFVLVLVVFGISMCSSDEKGSAPPKTSAQISADEVACKKDLQCWGDKHSIAASVYCAPYIEKLAKYNFEWTDSMMQIKLTKYLWKDVNKGVISYLGDRIKFQNGFGAMENYMYQCDYDTINEKVLDVIAEPGRF